jgi:hypothetical protein
MRKEKEWGSLVACRTRETSTSERMHVSLQLTDDVSESHNFYLLALRALVLSTFLIDFLAITDFFR